MFPLGIHCGGARGWAGLSRGWGILGVRAACSGKAGGGVVPDGGAIIMQLIRLNFEC